MLKTSPQLRCDVRQTRQSDVAWDDVSPFGLQGLRRDALRILKPDCLGRLAVTLAMTGTRKEIRDNGFVSNILRRNAGWMDEYQVVHLIEKSLWINGQSDLVMTLTRNPSQIPDNPPPGILKALTRSYALHPDGVTWYGVPVFGDQTTPQGLPIPLTAQQVRAENERRIKAAQTHALRYGWFYRAAFLALGVPFVVQAVSTEIWRRGTRAVQGSRDYCQRARRDARRRRTARIVAEMEYYRTGRSWTEIPEHTTLLGRVMAQSMETAEVATRKLAVPATVMGVSTAGLTMAKLAPLFFVPMTIVSADPFLFVELPEEPGKLRHLGHWYWQGPAHGKQRLHLHV